LSIKKVAASSDESGPRQVPHVLRVFSGRKHQSADPSVVSVDDELAQRSSGVGPLRGMTLAEMAPLQQFG
jgi:hypothetical protein